MSARRWPDSLKHERMLSGQRSGPGAPGAPRTSPHATETRPSSAAEATQSLLRRRSRCPPRVDNLTDWIRYHELRFCPNAQRLHIDLQTFSMLLTISTATCTERAGCTDSTEIALTALTTLGLSDAPFHELCHARSLVTGSHRYRW